MSHNVLVVAASYSMNLGDDVIMDCVCKACGEVSGQTPLRLSISGMPGYQDKKAASWNPWKTCLRDAARLVPAYRAHVRAKGEARLREALKRLDLDDFDVIIFAGGQLFMDPFIHLLKVYVEYAQRYNKKIIFNCIGLGHLSAKNRTVLSGLLSSRQICSITLRDGVERFKRIYGGGLEVRQTLDPAIEASGVYHIQKNVNSRKIGIGLISLQDLSEHGVRMTKQRYRTMTARIIEACQANRMDPELFTNGSLRDQELLDEFVSEFKRKGIEVFAAKRCSRPQELVRLISSYRGIVSFRLHSHIIAASLNIPSVGIVWDRKVQEFMHGIGRDDAVISLTGKQTGQKITCTVDSLCRENEYSTQRRTGSSYEDLQSRLRIIWTAETAS